MRHLIAALLVATSSIARAEPLFGDVQVGVTRTLTADDYRSEERALQLAGGVGTPVTDTIGLEGRVRYSRGPNASRLFAGGATRVELADALALRFGLGVHAIHDFARADQGSYVLVGGGFELGITAHVGRFGLFATVSSSLDFGTPTFADAAYDNGDRHFFDLIFAAGFETQLGTARPAAHATFAADLELAAAFGPLHPSTATAYQEGPPGGVGASVAIGLGARLDARHVVLARARLGSTEGFIQGALGFEGIHQLSRSPVFFLGGLGIGNAGGSFDNHDGYEHPDATGFALSAGVGLRVATALAATLANETIVGRTGGDTYRPRETHVDSLFSLGLRATYY